MVYPHDDNDDNGGNGEKNNPKCNGVTSLRREWRRRRRGGIDAEEGGERRDETSDIAGMGLMTLCEFEYDDDACFAATATDNGEYDDQGEGEHGENDQHGVPMQASGAATAERCARDAPEPGVLTTGDPHHLASPPV
jgi:hypothetical protein